MFDRVADVRRGRGAFRLRYVAVRGKVVGREPEGPFRHILVNDGSGPIVVAWDGRLPTKGQTVTVVGYAWAGRVSPEWFPKEWRKALGWRSDRDVVDVVILARDVEGD